ncbi:MAG: Helicase associated domain protein [Mycobacteriales bacterium]
MDKFAAPPLIPEPRERAASGADRPTASPWLPGRAGTGIHLRDYQRQAVDAIYSGLGAGGRGWIQAACGTGKTRIGIAAALELCPRGLVVVVCPTLALVAKWLSDWRTLAGSESPLAVCSDDELGAGDLVHVADLSCRVSVDIDTIVNWLGASSRRGGLRLVVTTYRSAPRVGEALGAAGAKADLLICDEAHHTAGFEGKQAAAVHDDERVPARRRLAMTATPRMIKVRGRDRPPEMVGMDDEAVFGPRLFHYSFARARAEGWLDGYQLVVLGVRRPELLAWLRALDPNAATATPGAPTIRRMLAQAALAQAMRDHDLRSILVFGTRVAAAAEFARTLPMTLNALPVDRRPDCPVTARHLSGSTPGKVRDRLLAELADPPGGGATVLANVKVLAEGVDVPAVDAVLFESPKHSTVDIVQAVGRALRPDPAGRRDATIIVPLLLPDGPDSDADPADLQGFDLVVQVVQALRAHDELFASALDTCRAQPVYREPTQLPAQIVVKLPDGYDESGLLQQLTTRVIESVTTRWPRMLALANDYYNSHGDLLIPKDYEVAGEKLGTWIVNRRRDYLQGRLSAEHVAELDAIGMVWKPQEARWLHTFKLVCAYRHQHRRLPVVGCVEQGLDLGAWLAKQRARDRAGTMLPHRKALLDEHGISLDPQQARWELMYAAAAHYHTVHGHLRVRGDESIELDGQTILLGAEIRRWRSEHRTGDLPSEYVVALDGLGMEWDPRGDPWEDGLAAARRFFTKHGHLRPAKVRDNKELIFLFNWLHARRAERRKGQLRPERIAALDEMEMVWDLQAEAWRDGLASTQDYYRKHGHLRVQRGAFKTGNGVDLCGWLAKQRARYKEGRLHPDQVGELEAAGMDWDPFETAWQEGLDAARRYFTAYGHLRVPQGHVDGDNFALGNWIQQQRNKFCKGTLPAHRVVDLTEAGMVWPRTPGPNR